MMSETPQDKRTMIADAALRVAADDGLDAVSLRSVAKAAGISMGQVQYHFASVADMMYAAMERAITLADEAVERYLAEYDRPDDLMAPMRAFTLALLSDDPQVQTFIRVLSQYEMWSKQNPRVMELLHAGDEEVLQIFAEAIRTAQKRRLLHKRVDPEREASLFLLLLGAVSGQVATGRMSRDDGIEMMRYHLRRLGR